ncbi:RluA family pseudouridine synthase [Peptoniphilus sp. oral taxon 386]|uniref:RluA family pseudouridine synthase n=1 Tax=Peptoniphilus sp. oral taxon 386 TaxID=652713 RepID=UPI0002E168E0|nr:RluA family pseudouridine synthase [Peptoniphilus sp. oral taxon 386]
MNYFNSYEGLSFKILDGNIKIRDFLVQNGLSSRFIRGSIEEENIYLNGEKIYRNELLRENDELFVKFSDESLNAKVQHGKLDIIYEDDDIVVVNKPPYMVTHTAKDDVENTLLNFVAGYFEDNKIRRKVRIVNRLDRDTSGIVIVAKNSFSHSSIQEQFGDSVKKEYVAIVNGIIKNDSGIIEKPIDIAKDGIRRIVSPDGKYSKTSYEVIKRNDFFTLVKLRLYTGRTHQIRVHMSHMGTPILGDALYGSTSNLILRQALHCYEMEIIHPRTKKLLKFIAPVPKDMENIVR